MIRLAAKLGAERKVEISAPLADKPNLPIPGAKDDESDKDSFKSAKSTTDIPDLVKDGREKVNKPVPLPPVEQPRQAENVSRKDKKKKSRTAMKANKVRQAARLFRVMFCS
jgi:poly(A)-specific ribonuclease